MASHVSEVYSPPRVTALATEFRLIPGVALDRTQTDPDDGLPWDFNNGKKRRKAEWLKTRRSLLLIGSPHVHGILKVASCELQVYDAINSSRGA